MSERIFRIENLEAEVVEGNYGTPKIVQIKNLDTGAQGVNLGKVVLTANDLEKLKMLLIVVESHLKGLL